MFVKTLLSSSPDVVKLRSQFAVFIVPTSEREDGRDRTRRKSQSAHNAFFMVGGSEFHERLNTGKSWSVCKGSTDTGKTTTSA